MKILVLSFVLMLGGCTVVIGAGNEVNGVEVPQIQDKEVWHA